MFALIVVPFIQMMEVLNEGQQKTRLLYQTSLVFFVGACFLVFAGLFRRKR